MTDDAHGNIASHTAAAPAPPERSWRNRWQKHSRSRLPVGVLFVILLAYLMLARLFLEESTRGFLVKLWEEHPWAFGAVVVGLSCALIFFLAGIFFAVVFRDYLNEFPSFARRMKADHEGTQKAFDEWVASADKVLSKAEKGTLQDLWLSRPWEYIEFVEECDSRFKGKEDHIGHITLYGTMVGFAFLLPEALRNHACRAGGQFGTLTLIASDAQTSFGEESKDLVHYPLWLAASFIKELLRNCSRFETEILTTGHQLKIEICYLPHDLLSAAIHLPQVEVAVLQALDSETFYRVLDGEELQSGFRYPHSGRRDAYDRYRAVLESMAEQFHRTVDRRVGLGQEKCEVWTLKGPTPMLSVSNPHWVWNSGGISRILTSTEYRQAGDRAVTFPNGLVTVTDFADGLLRALRVTGSTGTQDLTKLESVVAARKSQWARRWQMVCPCRTAASSLPQAPRAATRIVVQPSQELGS